MYYNKILRSDWLKAGRNREPVGQYGSFAATLYIAQLHLEGVFVW